MNWLHYLLEANLYLAVFYAGYYLFLSRETYYTLNRVYLLFSCVISFALPVLQLDMLKPVQQPVTAVQFAFRAQTAPVYTVKFVPVAAPQFTLANGLLYAYFAGTVILLLVLLIKLYRLFRLTRVENLGSDDNYKLVYIDKSTTAFSFFNYLFIGTKVQGPETIIKHELVHIRQKHSADIIFIELMKIVNWFNPVIYLLQYSIKTLHEYIADEQTASSETDALTYSSFLVSNAYGLDGASITNSFFNYNLLKKRIIMLNQKRSGSLARLKYLLAVPIFGGLLCASTLAFSKTYGWVDIGPHRIDKHNKSAQVAEPGRRLLVTQHGISVITDKFSHKYPDGSVRYYTVNNLSNKVKVDLKKQGIDVNIISDVKIDTTKAHIPPPPPPSPPVARVKFPAPKPPYPTTSKGYKYFESGYVSNGKPDISVSILEKKEMKVFDKNKSSAETLEMLKSKYGYTFPAHLYTPPSPRTPKGVKIPPPAVKAVVPVPVKFGPPVVSNVTGKGYKFEQDGYAVNGKTDFRVLITEKDGTQKEFYKSKATAADLNLLNEKYGYSFPVMQIYTKMPPPAPVAPVPAVEKHSMMVPAKLLDQSGKGVIYHPDVKLDQISANGDDLSHTPAIVVNGQIYKLTVPFKKGERLCVDADTARAVMYTDKDLVAAIQKYGPDAKNGVIFATGKTKVYVK